MKKEEKNIIIFIIILIVAFGGYDIYKSNENKFRINTYIEDFNGKEIFKSVTDKYGIENTSIKYKKSFLLQTTFDGKINFMDIISYINKDKVKKSFYYNIKELFNRDKKNYYVYSLLKVNHPKDLIVLEERINVESFEGQDFEVGLYQLLEALERMPWEKIFSLLKENYEFNIFDKEYRNFRIVNVYNKEEMIPFEEGNVYFLVDKLGNIEEIKERGKFEGKTKIIEFKTSFSRSSMYGASSKVIILVETSELKQ